MGNLKDELEQYGVNMKEAMDRFVEDMDLYEMCLREFSSDQGYEMLKEHMAAGAYEDAFNDAHTLKGVAGNLALTPLYNAICELVEKLRAKDYVGLDPYYEKIMEYKEKLDTLL